MKEIDYVSSFNRNEKSFNYIIVHERLFRKKRLGDISQPFLGLAIRNRIFL